MRPGELADEVACDPGGPDIAADEAGVDERRIVGSIGGVGVRVVVACLEKHMRYNPFQCNKFPNQAKTPDMHL